MKGMNMCKYLEGGRGEGWKNPIGKQGKERKATCQASEGASKIK